MKKKIKSAVISIVVIAVLLLAILIGVKNGTLDKLTKEMPTLATNQAETEKATVNARNNSTESKPYDGIEVAEYGEEFVIRRKIDGRKYDENDRTTYNIYHVKVNDCKISRQCDFDINRLDFGLDNKKKSLDENNNFISDFYEYEVNLMPGFKEFISHYDSINVIGTSCDEELVKIALNRLAVLNYFEDIITCSKVNKSKNDPDFYLACAQVLKQRPEDIVVFEDADYCIDVARKVGFKVIKIKDWRDLNEKCINDCGK